jgi:hypothetical protein
MAYFLEAKVGPPVCIVERYIANRGWLGQSMNAIQIGVSFGRQEVYVQVYMFSWQPELQRCCNLFCFNVLGKHTIRCGPSEQLGCSEILLVLSPFLYIYSTISSLPPINCT